MNIQPFLIGQGWMHMLDGDPSCRAIFDRHYSRYVYADGRKPKLFVGPGEKMVLMQSDGTALCVWRKFISGDGQQGVNCAIYRNESERKASEMLREAMNEAWQRWPGERFYTYVNPRNGQANNRTQPPRVGLVLLQGRLVVRGAHLKGPAHP